MTPETLETSLTSAAARYANLGLYLFPYVAVAKVPYAESHGHLDASNDPIRIVEMVRERIASGQAPGLGLATGASRILVIDIDSTEAGTHYRRLAGDHAFDTLKCGTRRGWQFHYRVPDGIELPNGKAAVLGIPGLDTRCGSTWAALPPSPFSKHAPGVYTWIGHELDEVLRDYWQLVMEAPESVLDIVWRDAAQRREGKLAQHRNTDGVLRIPKGKRHEALTAVAGVFASVGMSQASIRESLEAVGKHDAEVPYTQPADLADLDRIAKDAGEGGDWTRGVLPFTETAKPIPLGVKIDSAPGFPVDALPSWLATYCRAWAESTQTPVDAIAVLALGVFATIMQGRVVVRLNADWTEETCLFVLLVMPSGAKKSPTFRAAFAPIRQAERELRRDLEPARLDAQRRVAIAKERVDLARKAAKGGATSDERHKLEQAYIDADDERRQAEADEAACVPPVFHADDITPEAFSALLEVHERMTIASPEGGWFGGFAGRYSEGRANFDALLKGYSGDGIRVHRKGSAMVDIPHAIASVVVAVQPDVLREMVGTRGARDRGLLARFVKSAPPTKRGYRNVTNPEPMPSHVREEYAARVKVTLYDLRERVPSVVDPDDERERVCLEVQLDAEAARMFVDFRERHEVESRPGGRVHEIDMWAEKHAGNVARIAAVLHFAEHTTDAPDMPIGADTLASAIRIGDYFIEQEVTLDRFASQSSEMHSAQRVLDWIADEQRDTFTTRDVTVAKRGTVGLHDADSVRRALDVLVMHGYIRRVPGDTGKPGRPSEAWEVVPPHTQNAQNPERAGFVDIVDAVTGEVAA